MPLSTAVPSTSPPTSSSGAAPSGVVADPRRRRFILIAMCIALVAVVASVSGLNVAQQSLAVDLGASQSTLLWIINGYTLALASLLMPFGAVGDRWGRKPLLVAGLALFAGANLMAAFAGTSNVLLFSRVIAGVAAAMIMPVTLSVITSSFPTEEKPRAIALWAGFVGAGGIIGLFISSIVVDNFTWPWVFATPIVLAIGALVLAIPSVPNTREARTGRFDVGGSVLSALAIGAVVLGIHEGPEQGWGAPLTVAGLLVGVVAALAFVAWERRQDAPLFDVRLFADRGLAAGSVSLLVAFGVMFGLFLVLIQYLQAVLGYSAIRAAAGLIPMAVAMMGLSSASPAVTARLGTRRTLLLGLGVFGLGLAILAGLSSVDGGYVSALPGLVIVGIGMAFTMTPSTTAITSSLPEEKQGVASALNDTVREVGGAVGIALLGSVLNSGYRSGVSSVASTLPSGLASSVREGIGSALPTAAALGRDGSPIADAARQAFMDGWHTTMWVGVALTAVAFVYVLVRGPRTEEVASRAIGEVRDLPVAEAQLDGIAS